MLYSVLYSFYLQIIKKIVFRFSTFPRSIISVPRGIVTVPGGFILRFINLLFCNLIGQIILCMVEYTVNVHVLVVVIAQLTVYIEIDISTAHSLH